MKYSYDYYFAHPTLSVDPIFGHVMSKKENCLKLLQLSLPELNLVKIERISEQKAVSIKMLEHGVRYDVRPPTIPTF